MRIPIAKLRVEAQTNIKDVLLAAFNGETFSSPPIPGMVFRIADIQELMDAREGTANLGSFWSSDPAEYMNIAKDGDVVLVAKQSGRVQLNLSNTQIRLDDRQAQKEAFEEGLIHYHDLGWKAIDELEAAYKIEQGNIIEADHDYDPNWDYEVSEQVPEEIAKLAEAIKNELIPQTGNFEVHFVDDITELGRYVDGTVSRPVVLLNPTNIMNTAEKYNVDLHTTILTTIVHELGHAAQEAQGLEHDEEEAEAQAKLYWETGQWKLDKFEAAKFRVDADNILYEKPYGGISTGGGYGSNTEYEVGAQRIAEAVHCILGSLWERDMSHIQEEMALVTKHMGEYGRPIYNDRLNNPRDELDVEYISKSIQSIQDNSPQLIASANNGLSKLMNQDIPEDIMYAAQASYYTLIALAEAMQESIATDPITNAFQNQDLQNRLEELQDAVANISESQ